MSNLPLDLPREPLEIARHYMDSAPVDLSALAADLGLSVNLNAKIDDDLSGRIIRSAESVSGYHVDVNGSHSMNRKRFTLAHEIAHYLLHRDLIGDGINDTALYRSSLSDAIEIRANSFAANLLMPAPLLRRLYHAGLKYLSGLSRAFEVSEDAMRIRLKQLGLGS